MTTSVSINGVSRAPLPKRTARLMEFPARGRWLSWGLPHPLPVGAHTHQGLTVRACSLPNPGTPTVAVTQPTGARAREIGVERERGWQFPRQLWKRSGVMWGGSGTVRSRCDHCNVRLRARPLPTVGERSSTLRGGRSPFSGRCPDVPQNETRDHTGSGCARQTSQNSNQGANSERGPGPSLYS